LKFPVQEYRLTRPNIWVKDYHECRSFKLSLGNSAASPHPSKGEIMKRFPEGGQMLDKGASDG
jgi:hypothetical protein